MKVKAAGVNPIDILMCNGYGSKMLNAMRCDSSGIEFPLTLGREFSGVVVQKGMGVNSSLQMGDEVWGVVQPHKSGSHAEYVVVPSFCVSFHCFYKKLSQEIISRSLENQRFSRTLMLQRSFMLE